MTHPMNMPYISLETAFKAVDEVLKEYEDMYINKKNYHEQKVGRIGIAVAKKNKKKSPRRG